MNISPTIIESPIFTKKTFQNQMQIIKSASEVAQKKIDYHSAHSVETVNAIHVVEDFLRKKHRLCYGGQAINAHLPSKYKIYDPELSVPDYDFFTPDQMSDIKILVKELQQAGFSEISAREGMHEGTVKIYVNFIPVADMTSLDPKLYKILSKREYKYDGISYLDANTLRMLMYLELSRPRGEVERWPKIFERLALFNEFVPVTKCVGENRANVNKKSEIMTEEQSEFVMNYIIEHKRVFAGADLVGYYGTSFSKIKKSGQWLVKNRKPVIFYSPDPENDAKLLRAEFNSLNGQVATSIKKVSTKSADLIPPLYFLIKEKKVAVIIVGQTACHSYFNIPVMNDKILRIASTDTLITLYFSLGLLNNKYMNFGAMECLANEMVLISTKARSKAGAFPFPFISIKCSGYQTSLPSLIREKVKRITLKKKLMIESKKKRENSVENSDGSRIENSVKNNNSKNRVNTHASNKSLVKDVNDFDKI